jgi:DNA-binding PadR family transcriptional regulator
MHSHRRRSGWSRRYHRGGWGASHGYGGHRARRGDVRSAILALLEERPMHGYEMIQELDERSGGRWRPSAGSIYPTLQLLADEGLVSAEEVDGRRVFSLTEAGRKAAEERSERSPWEDGDEGSPHHRLRSSAIQLGRAAMQVGQAGSDDQVERSAEILTDARRRIYSILAEDEEQAGGGADTTSDQPREV